MGTWKEKYQRRQINLGNTLEKERLWKEKQKVREQTPWPTIPCCDAMRAGLACECCEVVDC